MSEQNPDKEIEIRTAPKKGPLAGLLFILVALAGYMFLARPVSAQIDSIKADLSGKNEQVKVLEEKVNEFKQAKEELGLATEVERLEILKAIPAGLDQDNVIRDIIDVAESYHIGLKSISFSKGSTNYEGVFALRVSASFEGNYVDLTDFLQGLEQNARLFKVDSISVQINRLDITDIERANFSLVIETYFQQ